MIKVSLEYDDRNVLNGYRPSFEIIISGEDENISKEKINKIINIIQEVLF